MSDACLPETVNYCPTTPKAFRAAHDISSECFPYKHRRSISIPLNYRHARGFCLNEICRAGNMNFFVEGNSKPIVFYTDKRSMVDCPSCKHALFWSRIWKEK